MPLNLNSGQYQYELIKQKNKELKQRDDIIRQKDELIEKLQKQIENQKDKSDK